MFSKSILYLIYIYLHITGEWLYISTTNNITHGICLFYKTIFDFKL